MHTHTCTYCTYTYPFWTVIAVSCIIRRARVGVSRSLPPRTRGLFSQETDEGAIHQEGHTPPPGFSHHRQRGSGWHAKVSARVLHYLTPFTDLMKVVSKFWRRTSHAHCTILTECASRSKYALNDG